MSLNPSNQFMMSLELGISGVPGAAVDAAVLVTVDPDSGDYSFAVPHLRLVSGAIRETLAGIDKTTNDPFGSLLFSEAETEIRRPYYAGELARVRASMCRGHTKQLGYGHMQKELV